MMQDFLFYLNLGWEHIISLDALDHQLFVLALIAVYSFNDLKKILILVTAFTIGHSITLALSIFDIVRINSAWVEFLIPLTIVLTALGNIVMKNKKQSQNTVSYYLALIFGLIHGMGFANTARVMIAKSQSITIPLLGFNIGLELGQIAIVFGILILLFILLKICKVNQKDWILFVSSGVFALSLKMTLERIPF
ncbi:HupE / UreJ protein [Chryseobacterium arachidis]|uniref:HupE / UreJ protein n=3 Tax=Chryseobacterium arachidis TaxID=1416778 RepID=A0A1M4ZY46_9FLAO|nr:HupE / UreJ protein [Chryseobacterium arachidis]